MKTRNYIIEETDWSWDSKYREGIVVHGRLTEEGRKEAWLFDLSIWEMDGCRSYSVQFKSGEIQITGGNPLDELPDFAGYPEAAQADLVAFADECWKAHYEFYAADERELCG